MGYFGGGASGGGVGHTHPNKAVLDQIIHPGSGQIITAAERDAIGRYSGPGADNWSGAAPTTTDAAIARLAAALKNHLGIEIPEL